MAVWLAFRVTICSECRVWATMSWPAGCNGAELCEDTSLVSAAFQSMAYCFWEPKLFPLGVCIADVSQVPLASKLWMELCRACAGVGTIGMRGWPEPFLATITSWEEPEAGGCFGTTSFFLEGCCRGGVWSFNFFCCSFFFCCCRRSCCCCCCYCCCCAC